MREYPNAAASEPPTTKPESVGRGGVEVHTQGDAFFYAFASACKLVVSLLAGHQGQERAFKARYGQNGVALPPSGMSADEAMFVSGPLAFNA